MGVSGRTGSEHRRAGRITAIDLTAEHASLQDELETVVRRVLVSGRYVGGPEVEGLEREFAAFCGTESAVAVNSGTDALRFALISAGVGEGGGTARRAGRAPGPDAALDEVVTSPLTFVATTEAISQAGARPVFADVDPASLTLDPVLAGKAATARTKAIVPVHLYGQTADMDPILDLARARGLAVVEDACQAHGALYRGRSGGEGRSAGSGHHAEEGLTPGSGRAAGSLGDAGCFSFYPSKNLGACGEGGMITTARADIAERARRLRDHGQLEKYVHAEEGYNGRLDALQAAILRVKLKRLAGWNARRRALAARYSERLREMGLAAEPEGEGIPGETREPDAPLLLPVEKPWGAHVFHQYTVRVRPERGGSGPSARDRVRALLLERGIETGIHYPIPLHLQPCYAWMGLKEGSFPVAERAAREVLSLPLYPELAESQVERVCEALRNALGRG